MARTKVNLTLDHELTAEARKLGLNMSRIAEAALSEAARLERNRNWREQNREAIEAYEREVEKNGLPLVQFRTF